MGLDRFCMISVFNISVKVCTEILQKSVVLANDFEKFSLCRKDLTLPLRY